MDGAIVVGLPIVVKINCRWSGSPGSIWSHSDVVNDGE